MYAGGCHIMFSYVCEYNRTSLGDIVCWPMVTNVENYAFFIGPPIKNA